jgi:hypothetical protein
MTTALQRTPLAAAWSPDGLDLPPPRRDKARDLEGSRASRSSLEAAVSTFDSTTRQRPTHTTRREAAS